MIFELIYHIIYTVYVKFDVFSNHFGIASVLHKFYKCSKLLHVPFDDLSYSTCSQSFYHKFYKCKLFYVYFDVPLYPCS